MPSEKVHSQLMYDVYQEEFVYVLFLGTLGLYYEAFSVVSSSATDVVNFLAFHVSPVLGNTSVVMIISSSLFFVV